MTIDQARTLIIKLEWTFAKTYADKSPHEYAICRVGDPLRKEFLAFAEFILSKGDDELYYGHPFVVYKLDGRKYWCMITSEDDLNDKSYIINRSMEYNVDTVYA